MSKIILDTEDFFQNDGYDDLMHIDHESYCCGEMFEKYETKIADLEAKLAESEKELLQKEKKIEDLMVCEFVATTLDFNKLSADNCRLREQLADIEANKEKEINRICKTHIEANAQLKQQLAEKDKLINNYGDDLEKVANENADLVFKLAEKEKEIESLKVDGVLNEELEEKDYAIIKPFLKETLTIEEIKHIIKNLSDFNLRQTSFHDIQKNDVIFNAYINKHIAYKKCLDLLNLVDQDKISFAVAELNKLWDCLYKTDDKGYVIRFASMNDRDKFNEVFNNQIKQLKEGK